MNSDSNVFLRRNLEDIKSRVEKAAAKSGRNAEDIKIIAVTKTIDNERIKNVIEQDMVDLGENRVQELCDKYNFIEKKCNWHLIGHLQTNKVKYIVDKVHMIHSVDRIDLVDEIQKRAEKIDKVIDILVQVNIAEEESKFGMHKEHVMDFVKRVSSYKNIKIKGLMTIAPYAQNPEEIRYVFRELRKIFIDIREENIDNIDMDYLSMGMSNDFEIAIEEGSNIVRIGTGIFGQREYNKL